MSLSDKSKRMTVFLVLAVLLVTGRPAFAEKAKNSLYERLGGVYAIATVVEDFIDRVVANGTLNANPAIDAARKQVPTAGLKY